MDRRQPILIVVKSEAFHTLHILLVYAGKLNFAKATLTESHQSHKY